ncbi:Solute carrier family 23 member 2, partial [Armadillidium vulgare]
LTVFEVFPKDSEARTDSKITLIRNSRWFYVPYPFQWGFITVTTAGVIGMIAGVLSSIVESIGDFYACSHLTESGSIPDHALNRDIFIEGIECIIAGIIGTGNGTTTYSTTIPALRVTKIQRERETNVR